MALGSVGDGIVVLREWDVEDAEWYASTAARDELIQRFTTESPTVTAEQVRAAIVALRARPVGAAGFLIADAATGERLGNIALTHDHGAGEVSYWLAPHARGRGLATRALFLFSQWAFRTLDLRELCLWARVDNKASRAVAERAGYERDPTRDQRRVVKGETWETVAYARRRPRVLSQRQAMDT